MLSKRVVSCFDVACSANSAEQLPLTSADQLGLAIGADGSPLVVVHDTATGSVDIVHCGSTGCRGGTPATVEVGAVAPNFPSVVVPPDGVPVVSFSGVDGLVLARPTDAGS